MDLAEFTGLVGFLGAGNMATALVRGMVSGGIAPERVLMNDVDAHKVDRLARDLGIAPEADAQKLVAKCSVVVLAVKPSVVIPLLEGLAAAARDQLWLSVAAGISCGQMEQALGGGARVVRAMPNTPALIGEGASALCKGSGASDGDLQLARALLATVGHTEELPESMMDVVTGLSGSGPAFVMLMLEALADGAVFEGLPRPVALRLAAQTMRGAAALLDQTGKHPGELKDMVTSPGGTTIYGVEALERGGFRSAVMSAVIAASRRSKEFSK